MDGPYHMGNFVDLTLLHDKSLINWKAGSLKSANFVLLWGYYKFMIANTLRVVSSLYT